ncbi:MAG: hypothetical protein ABL996_19140 [Micropepsaceae bacterium]
MRTIARTAFAGLCLALSATSVHGQDEVPADLAYPGTVALSKNPAGEWIYRKFPSLMPLYTYGGDIPGSGKSTCNIGCIGPWPPVRAEAADTPVGNWTIIDRTDGRRQWAYKGHPVYMRYHDEINNPIGDGEEGKWHLLKP